MILLTWHVHGTKGIYSSFDPGTDADGVYVNYVVFRRVVERKCDSDSHESCTIDYNLR